VGGFPLHFIQNFRLLLLGSLIGINVTVTPPSKIRKLGSTLLCCTVQCTKGWRWGTTYSQKCRNFPKV